MRTIKKRVEALENRTKQARNDQTIYNNYSVEQVERSKQLLYEVILEEIKAGRLR